MSFLNKEFVLCFQRNSFKTELTLSWAFFMFALETIRTYANYYTFGNSILVGISINNMILDRYIWNKLFHQNHWNVLVPKDIEHHIVFSDKKTFDILNRYHRQICNLSGSLPMQLSPAQNTDKTEMLLYFINVEKNRCFCYIQKQRKWDLIFLPNENKYKLHFLLNYDKTLAPCTMIHLMWLFANFPIIIFYLASVHLLVSKYVSRTDKAP